MKNFFTGMTVGFLLGVLSLLILEIALYLKHKDPKVVEHFIESVRSIK
jgi:hypothetical protein